MKIEYLILEKILEEKYPSFEISYKDEFQCIWKDCHVKMTIGLNYASNSPYVFLNDFETQFLRYPILMELRKKQTWIKAEDFIEAHSED